MIVFICEELTRSVNGLELEDISSSLPGADVRLVSGSCDRPDRWLASEPNQSERFVLGVCAAREDRKELHARFRKLGVDPCAVEIVDLGGCLRDEAGVARVKLLLQAAVAKVRAYGGSRPENARMMLNWEQQMSRRALFTLPPVRYEVIPSIREEACVADQGCRICGDLCPHAALTSSEDGRMILNKDKCTGCGACVSVCPREAYEFPGASLPQLQAQVGALLQGAGETLGHRRILFLCHNAAAALRESGEPLEEWLPVEIPCLGMVTPGWILQCLNQGATAVDLLSCPGEECRFGEREELKERVGYCWEFLHEIGLPPDAVRLFEPGKPAAPAPSGPIRLVSGENGTGSPQAAPRFSPHGTAEAILGLARRCRAPFDLALDHPHSPLGVVDVGDGCTSCGACVSACPASALSLDQENEGITLAFHAPVCVGCGGCVPVCPEKVIKVTKRTDLSILAQGKRPLHHDTAPRCVNCGEPVAPQAMLDHIASRLGDSPVLSTLRKYCLECRKTKF